MGVETAKVPADEGGFGITDVRLFGKTKGAVYLMGAEGEVGAIATCLPASGGAVGWSGVREAAGWRESSPETVVSVGWPAAVPSPSKGEGRVRVENYY